MEHLISVLMSVYNTPVDFLTRAVDSILKQSYQKWELIIVDDASDDTAVLDYLENMLCQDDRIRLIHNQTNMGLTKSLNIGLACCRGKYVARMDSDDISIPSRFEQQVSFLESNPNVSLVGSEILLFGDHVESRESAYSHLVNDHPEVYKIRSLMQHSGPAHPTFCIRADFLHEHDIKYREEILKAQDYGLMADILMHEGEIRVIKEPLLKYRIHDGQITSEAGIEQKTYQCIVSREFVHFLFPELTEVECEAIAMLGNDVDLELIVKEIKSKMSLAKVGRNLLENAECLKQGMTYIDAIRKVININRQTRHYDPVLFEREMRRELWRKMLRMHRNNGDNSIFRPYVLCSYYHTRKVRREAL